MTEIMIKQLIMEKIPVLIIKNPSRDFLSFMEEAQQRKKLRMDEMRNRFLSKRQ